MLTVLILLASIVVLALLVYGWILVVDRAFPYNATPEREEIEDDSFGATEADRWPKGPP